MARLTLTLLGIALGCGSASNDGPGVDGSAPDAPVDSSSGGDAGGDSDGGPACGDLASMMPAWSTHLPTLTEIHVAPTGDDSGDGSVAHPLETVAAAMKKIAPGVRVDFASGTYDCTGFTFANQKATTALPIVLYASDGPRTAKFDCKNSGGGDGLYFSIVSSVVIDGLEVMNAGGHGIHFDSGGGPWSSANISSDLVVRNCYVHDVGGNGIKAGESQRIADIGNETSGVKGGFDHAYVASTEVTIAGNLSHDSGAFDEVKGGAQGSVIARNVLRNNVGGILVGGDCTGQEFLLDPSVDYEASGLVVWGNVAVVSTDGMRIVGCKDCLVANNTVYNTAPHFVVNAPDDHMGAPGMPGCTGTHAPNTNVRLVNNIFDNGTMPSSEVIATTLSPSFMTLDHNAWSAAGGDITTVYSDIPFKGDATSIYVDPKLASPVTDLSLASGSPARGAGVALAQVPGNATGACWAGTPDIGAY